MDHFIYLPEVDELGRHPISEKELHHLRNVLRAKVDDQVHVMNGKGKHFLARIQEISKKEAWVLVEEITRTDEEPNYTIHLAVAPIKNIDRFEFMVEKAVEIGATSITPVFCEHPERTRIRLDRLERIAISAMKQSRSSFKCQLNEACSIHELKLNEETKLIAHCHDTLDTQEISSLPQSNSTMILIGPEGDFSSSEIAWARAHKFTPISLGEKRLRTETVAIFALSIIKSKIKTHA